MICTQFLRMNFTELVSAWKKDQAWLVGVGKVTILYNKCPNLYYDVMTCFVLLSSLPLEMDYYTVWGTWKKIAFLLAIGRPLGNSVVTSKSFQAPLGQFCKCFWHEYREVTLFAWWSLQVWHTLDWNIKKKTYRISEVRNLAYSLAKKNAWMCPWVLLQLI